MNINKLESIKDKKLFLEKDENGREIFIYTLDNVIPINTFYPDVLLSSNGDLYNPISEKTMSLKSVEGNTVSTYDEPEVKSVIDNPLFFFIYNTDNYYHFVYDTLPYLISFLNLRKSIPELKLLMNYPNHNKCVLYKFVIEFLDILGIVEGDYIIINKNTMYTKVYISTSYTHDNKSEYPPRKEIFDLYNDIVNICISKNTIHNFPKKVYISRRTWENKDNSNIGTNYTTRRKLDIEDELVDVLEKNGYEEVFTESMTTSDKVIMFSKADVIIGSIGGGLCNVLYCTKRTKLISIISPTFLDINKRFLYSFNNVQTTYFDKTRHLENGPWKKYMRVECKELNIVGEIEEVYEETLLVSYTDKKVSGWNIDMELNTIELRKSDCIRLDEGLNSSWTFDINDILKIIEKS